MNFFKFHTPKDVHNKYSKKVETKNDPTIVNRAKRENRIVKSKRNLRASNIKIGLNTIYSLIPLFLSSTLVLRVLGLWDSA